jgi:hypothetical protein
VKKKIRVWLPPGFQKGGWMEVTEKQLIKAIIPKKPKKAK